MATFVVLVLVIAGTLEATGTLSDDQQLFAVGAADYGAKAKSNATKVYFFALDPKDGIVAAMDDRSVSVGPNPSWLCRGAKSTHMYACLESTSGVDVGGLAAFDVDARDKIGSVFAWPQDNGLYGPAHCEVESTHGDHIMAASWSLGQFGVFSLAEDGGIAKTSQLFSYGDKSHAHCVSPSPDGAFVFVVDLGLDCVHGYKWEQTRTNADHTNNGSRSDTSAKYELTPTRVLHLDSGVHPRHMAFVPEGKGGVARWALLVTESSNTLMVLPYNANSGTLSSAVHTVSTLPEGWNGVSFAGELLVHPSGDVAYVSNRGHDSVAVFAFYKTRGTLLPLSWMQRGVSYPRGMGLTMDGAHLVVANQQGIHGNTLVAFTVGGGGKTLAPLGRAVDVFSPTDVHFL